MNIEQYKKPALLILDEWLLYQLKESEARDLLEIAEARYKKGSMIFCSQFDVPGWRDKIGSPIIADAICDRIVHDSYRIVIECEESMRKIFGVEQSEAALRKNLCKYKNCDKKRYCRSGLKSRSDFFYSINWILQFVKILVISACWNGAQRNGIRLIAGCSAEPVGVHDLKLSKDFAPVSQRHGPFLSYLMCCQIQSL